MFMTPPAPMRASNSASRYVVAVSSSTIAGPEIPPSPIDARSTIWNCRRSPFVNDQA
jgi:hypothetical protein